TDARAVRPYNRYSSAGLTTDAVPFDTTDPLRLDTSVRPYTRYTSRLDTTDARAVRPYNRYSSRGALLVARS
ncbi:hypothetical protein, partial [uncultured Porphyromonas sp.]|uniref:hypothetical protein n=1 Tax=uncultured Porphyromonas sp. TaxID=159274 RepID=UPI0028042346